MKKKLVVVSVVVAVVFSLLAITGCSGNVSAAVNSGEKQESQEQESKQEQQAEKEEIAKEEVVQEEEVVEEEVVQEDENESGDDTLFTHQKYRRQGDYKAKVTEPGHITEDDSFEGVDMSTYVKDFLGDEYTIFANDSGGTLFVMFTEIYENVYLKNGRKASETFCLAIGPNHTTLYGNGRMMSQTFCEWGPKEEIYAVMLDGEVSGKAFVQKNLAETVKVGLLVLSGRMNF